MTTKEPTDWDPETYARFRGFRLRPALDLLAQVPALPAGDVVDLGCGNGMPATDLRLRFATPGTHRLIGVDRSRSMLAEAALLGLYDELIEADAAQWSAERGPAMIFSNALIHWLPNHEFLIPRLAAMLVDRGVLAVQMPRQFLSPSHRLLRDTAEAMFPDRFDFANWSPPVHDPNVYARLLMPFGSVLVWETEYCQHLHPVSEGHPVRHFTQSTAMRPFLEKLNEEETHRFVEAYEIALEQAYPIEPNGSVLMPFRRVFMVLTRTA